MNQANLLLDTRPRADEDALEPAGQRGFPYRFFVVTFLWSWLFCLPVVLGGLKVIPLGQELMAKVSLPLLILAVFGPAVGALYCLKTLDGKAAMRRYLRGLLDLRLGWNVWILPIFVLGGITCAAWLLPELWGEPHLPMRLPSLWTFPLFVLGMICLSGGQEELGWRGYILDPIEARLGPWLGNVVLGVVWAVWHLPLFVIPGNGQAFMPFAAFVLFTTGLSWFLSWARQASGKRTLSGVYVHGLVNVFGSMFPTLVMTAGSPQVRYWIWAGLVFAAGVAAMSVRSATSLGNSSTARAGASW